MRNFTKMKNEKNEKNEKNDNSNSEVLLKQQDDDNLSKEDSISKKVGPDGLIKIAFSITEEVYNDLIKIKEWYRSPSISHTFRLMIPDVAKGIEQNAPISRIAG